HFISGNGGNLDPMSSGVEDLLNLLAIGRHIRRAEGSAVTIEDRLDFHEWVTGSVAAAKLFTAIR
ncbi:MAG: hypothetical protein I8N66_34760, partial [Ensifer sp. SSB1]|nr:hypothetical protein [Ensifer sp. SSB1]